MKQLLEMPRDELKVYLVSIPIEERKLVTKELLKAISEQTFQKTLDHANRDGPPAGE